jgi:hypothetical protein
VETKKVDPKKLETKKTVMIPPPSSYGNKFPPPPPSSRHRARSRTPQPAAAAMISTEPELRAEDSKETADELHDNDVDFADNLPSFMKLNTSVLDIKKPKEAVTPSMIPPMFPPNFPPPPRPLNETFFPAGYLETRPKSAALVKAPSETCKAEDEEDPRQWTEWNPQLSLPPPPMANDSIEVRPRVLQVEVPRPPCPPRMSMVNAMQQEFPGATIVIIPPGTNVPFHLMQPNFVQPNFAQQNYMQQGMIPAAMMPNPWQFYPGQTMQAPTVQISQQWPGMFHSWRG